MKGKKLKEAGQRQEQTTLHKKWKITCLVETYSIHLLCKAQEAEIGYWNTYEYKLYIS